MEAWEDAVAILSTLLQDAEDDLEAGKLMSKPRVRQIELALTRIRDQRSRLMRQGILYEGGDG